MKTIKFGFEGTWHVVDEGGTGWLPAWWFPYGDLSRTCEYGHPEDGDPHMQMLVRTGKKSLGYDKVFDTHKGGAGRRISCAIDDWIRFRIYGRYIYHSPTSNTQPGALVSPVHMRIGIDPTGSREPTDQTVWSAEQEVAVEGFGGLVEWFLFEVKAQAKASKITIFLYTNPTYAGYRGNGPVWDDAIVEVGVEPPSHFSRMRTLPQDAELRQLFEVAELAYPERGTIGFSYDDTGKYTEGILFNIPEKDQQSFLDYFEKKYPDTAVLFSHTSDWVEPGKWDPYLLWQQDPLWKDHTFGPANCTVGNMGCFITCLAMAQQIYDIDPEATPISVDEALGEDGYAPDCLAEWEDITKDLKLVISSSTKAQADEHLNNGGVMMIEVLPSNLQHFVLAVENLGDDYLVLDPFQNVIAPLKTLYVGWESWRMLTPGTDPEPPPPPGPGPQYPAMDNLISLHLQTSMEGDTAFVEQMGEAIIKTFSFEHAAFFKERNPYSKTIVRMFTSDQPIGGDPVLAAKREIDRYRDSLIAFHETTDWIESRNEQYSSSDREANKWMVQFDEAFALQIADMGLNTRACGLVAAVGNPLESWVVDLIPAARALYETGGIIGYHGYWWGNPAADVLHEMESWAPWHLLRALFGWDPVFAAEGIFPRYVLTESGIVGSSDGYMLNAHAGWKSIHTLKANWDRYFTQIAKCQTMIEVWNASHGNRCMGATLFTTGQDYVNWLSFQIRKAEMEALATL